VRSLQLLAWWRQRHIAKTLPLVRLVVHWLEQNLAVSFLVLAQLLVQLVALSLAFYKE
jgi:aryl carrier-like protein